MKTGRIISAILCAAAIFLSGSYAALRVRYPVKYYDIVKLECSQRNVEPELVQGVIWAESKYRPKAVSSAGATGLMQLMPSTAEWCAEKIGEEYDASKLTDPSYNIKLGVFYLSFLLERFDETHAVAAYNAGPANVFRWIEEGREEIPFKETREYVKRVESAKQKYVYFNS